MIPDEATRLAALKGGEIDIVYSMRGELAEELQQTPGLTLKPVGPPGPWWLYFAEQWDPKSPWHDERVRRAANLAIDRKGINEALTSGYSQITGSIVPTASNSTGSRRRRYTIRPRPRSCWRRRATPTASMPANTTATRPTPISPRGSLDNLRQIGIRASCGHSSAPPFSRGIPRRSSKNIIQAGSAAFGNAATRIEAIDVKGGTYAYGDYPEIDELYPAAGLELDHAKRAAILGQDAAARLRTGRSMRQSCIFGFLNGIGPQSRQVHTEFELIPGFALHSTLRRHHIERRVIRRGEDWKPRALAPTIADTRVVNAATLQTS